MRGDFVGRIIVGIITVFICPVLRRKFQVSAEDATKENDPTQLAPATM